MYYLLCSSFFFFCIFELASFWDYLSSCLKNTLYLFHYCRSARYEFINFLYVWNCILLLSVKDIFGEYETLAYCYFIYFLAYTLLTFMVSVEKMAIHLTVASLKIICLFFLNAFTIVFGFQIFYSNLLIMLFLVVILIRIHRTCWMCVLMSSIRFVSLSFNISTWRFLEDTDFMIVILWDESRLALWRSGQFLETVLVSLRRMYIF